MEGEEGREEGMNGGWKGRKEERKGGRTIANDKIRNGGGKNESIEETVGAGNASWWHDTIYKTLTQM